MSGEYVKPEYCLCGPNTPVCFHPECDCRFQIKSSSVAYTNEEQTRYEGFTYIEPKEGCG